LIGLEGGDLFLNVQIRLHFGIDRGERIRETLARKRVGKGSR
jgi:hypothetical protein